MNEPALLGLENVLAVGRGLKHRRGQRTAHPAVVVLIEQGTKGRHRPDQAVPAQIDGTPTDVVEIEPMQPLSAAERVLMAGDTLVPLGRSVSGTAGMIYRLNGRDYCLSNWHVFKSHDGSALGAEAGHVLGAQSHLVGEVEFEARPGQTDADAVAVALHYCPDPLPGDLGAERPGNWWDAQIDAWKGQGIFGDQARLVGWPHYHGRYCGWTRARLEPARYVVAPKGLGHAGIGDLVKKAGAVTGWTEGEVLATHVTVAMQYGAPVGQVVMRNQVYVRRTKPYGPVVASGDSGSMVLDDRLNAVGLVFAGAPSNYLYTPIQTVLRALHGDRALEGYNLDREA